ncbi:hypothetical protein AGMMS50239_19590 [Bacteroidia bacterium]|nr:hypothetical protein AGMMS50239_19590 [Bacteroidia bacterium]
MPIGNVESGVWGDFADADGMMKDLYDCGYNTTGFVEAKYVKYALPYNLAVILYNHRVRSYFYDESTPDVTPKEAEEIVRSALNEIEPAELRKTVYSMYLRDEPNASLFPRLKVWSDAVKFGYRTTTWALMRNVNMQIHALAPVYCTLKSVNVFHTGKVPRNAQGKESAVHLKSINDEAFLVGEFVAPDGKPYLFVVNKDTKKSVKVDVAFKKEGKIIYVNPFGHGMLPFEGEHKWLAPGAGVLLTIE